MFGKNKNGCFDCDNCPETFDRTKKRFCHFWIKRTEKNTETEQLRVVEECGIPYLFVMLHDNTKAADRVTENLTTIPKRLREEFSVKVIPTTIKKIN